MESNHPHTLFWIPNKTSFEIDHIHYKPYIDHVQSKHSLGQSPINHNEKSNEKGSHKPKATTQSLSYKR